MRRLLCVVVLCIAGARSVRAEGTEWTVGAYLGAGHTAPADLTLRRADGSHLRFPDVPFDSRSLDAPPYYGYRIGRTLGSDRVSLEAELIHLKAYARIDGRSHDVNGAPLAQHVRSLAMSHGLNFLMLNAVLQQPLKTPAIVLVARGGIGALLPHVESETPEGRVDSYQLAGPGAQGAAGVEIRMRRWLYASGEYKYTYGRPRLEVAGADVDLTTRSHHVTIGLTAKLPAR